MREKNRFADYSWVGLRCEKQPLRLSAMAFPTKRQVSFTLQTLLTFVKSAMETKTLPPAFTKNLYEKGLSLLAEVENGKVENKAAVTAVKALIGEVNHLLPPKAPNFPRFVVEGPINHLKGTIIAFELFLNQKHKAQELTFEQEQPLFSESLVLWRDVGLRMTPEEAAFSLTQLIRKANAYLPKSEGFPLPEEPYFID